MIFLRYYIPARRINVAKLGLFIRKDWLDKLNMAEPTTTEEWVAYLRAAKEAKLGGEQTVPYAMKLYENSPLFSTSVIVDPSWTSPRSPRRTGTPCITSRCPARRRPIVC